MSGSDGIDTLFAIKETHQYSISRAVLSPRNTICIHHHPHLAIALLLNYRSLRPIKRYHTTLLHPCIHLALLLSNSVCSEYTYSQAIVKIYIHCFTMLIHVFGNPDLPFDALPVLLLPRLKQAFPEHDFRFTDPNELDLPASGSDFIALDTVDGLKHVRAITLDEIAATAARATTHDFDLASHLLLVQKLRPNIHIRIIGIPMHMHADTAFTDLLPFLTTVLHPEK